MAIPADLCLWLKDDGGADIKYPSKEEHHLDLPGRQHHSLRC